jgi:hypothetical protein
MPYLICRFNQVKDIARRLLSGIDPATHPHSGTEAGKKRQVNGKSAKNKGGGSRHRSGTEAGQTGVCDFFMLLYQKLKDAKLFVRNSLSSLTSVLCLLLSAL